MTKTLAFVLSATLAACAGQAEVHYSGDASRPELVAIDDDPGVSVVANADEPMFFAENTFWLYRDNTWYRSSSHRTGWARADAPPGSVTRISQPTQYVHYRRSEAGPRTTFNQHPPVEPRAPAPIAPEVRDHRDPRNEPGASPDQLRPQREPEGLPIHEPNPEGSVPPRPNPLPPNQVPPAATGQHDGPDHQLAPDPDRAPVSPGMRDRGTDQRPATP
jgi:hypothetical protein